MSKLAVFDFDDTLVTTRSKVKVIQKGEVIALLSSDEFAVHTLKRGQDYDFSNFERLVRPKNKEMLKVFRRLVKQRNGRGIVILTARADNSLDTLKSYLRAFCGPKFENVEVVCLGVSEPNAKANWIVEKIQSNKRINSVYFVDDSWKNVKAVGDAVEGIEQIRKLKLQKV